MYNRYINPNGFFNIPQRPESPPAYETQSNAGDEVFSEVFSEDATVGDTAASAESSKTGKGLFGGSFKLPDFNTDTILMLVLVYFLISDELTPYSKEDGEKDKKNITDTMLIIGALLLLGF